MKKKKNQIVDLACRLLSGQGRIVSSQDARIILLAGDGSQRSFYRFFLNDEETVVAVLPPVENDEAMGEARSAWQIGRHLFQAGVPVPEPLAFDAVSGMILFEDLGDVRLHEYLRQEDPDHEELIRIYTPVIRELVGMQVRGAAGFDTVWCWQSPRYDLQLMLERESGYFLQAFCRDLLGLHIDPTTLQAEFAAIAARAAAAPADFFLHRDLQSRNLMLKDNRIRIIDFQGGRLGPLGYDLACLLIDPYAGLPEAVQERLIDEYIALLSLHMACDAGLFRQEYLYLALQRNMQILGAFAFLGKQAGKPFFLAYIPPALDSLQTLLAKTGPRQYPVLQKLLTSCHQKVMEYGI